jgi:hypothetical protein
MFVLILLIIGTIATFYLYNKGIKRFYQLAISRGSWVFAWQFLIGGYIASAVSLTFFVETTYYLTCLVLQGEGKIIPLASRSGVVLISIVSILEFANLWHRWKSIRAAIAKRKQAKR